MKEIEGIRGAFRQAKVVYMTTFKNREENSSARATQIG